jgi:hypothetical protein
MGRRIGLGKMLNFGRKFQHHKTLRHNPNSMTVGIARKDGSVEDMEVKEFTRWMCLVEAFHFIEEKAKELNVNSEDMLKPLAIDAYIKERYDGMLHDVTCEIKLGLL